MAIGEQGKRVLIVEDEPLLAMQLEDMLVDLGHQVVAIATRLDKAMALARSADIDIAILDVNVAGSKSFPAADILKERRIPFLFATGYGAEGFLDGYRDEPTLQKPYESVDLQRAIAFALSTVTTLPPAES